MGWAATIDARGRSADAVTDAAAPPFVALVFCAIMFTEPVLNALIANNIIAQGDFVRLFWAPVYLALLPIAWRDRAIILAAAAKTPLLSALTVIALASCLWSVAPDVTFRRAIGLVVTMIFAWRLSALSWLDMARAAGAALLAMAALSFVFALAWPAAGIMGPGSTHPGAWAGVWPHKNVLGNMMGLGTGLFMALAIADAQRRRLWLAAIAGAVALCVLSTSATALVLIVVGGGLIGAGLLVRRGVVWATALVLASVIAGVSIWLLLLTTPTLLFDLLGRDATLTGRTEIWTEALRAIAERPATGYGFGAFWEAKEGPAFFLRAVIGWDAPNAHSGWLDLALALGWGATALCAMSAGATAFRATRALSEAPAGLIAPPFVAGLLMLTITEGYALQEHSLPWALFVAIAAKLAARAHS
jgi:O-antigen ligase